VVKSDNNLPAIGLLGGTFDPVHFGHLRTAVEVCQQFKLDHVRLLPNSVAPHRPQPIASAEERRLMLALATKNTSQLMVDDRELQRDGASYTVDTLHDLRTELPANSLFLIVGSDAFSGIQTWSRWQEILSLCHIIVVSRVDQTTDYADALQQWMQLHLAKAEDKSLAFGKIWPVDVTALAISATQIRQALAKDEAIDFLLPEAVISLISQLRLYQK
jgi:nicotinate-nucleotide adenylyltransferase